MQVLLLIALITAGQSPYFTTVLSQNYFQYLKIMSVKSFVPKPCPWWSLHWHFPGKQVKGDRRAALQLVNADESSRGARAVTGGNGAAPSEPSLRFEIG